MTIKRTRLAALLAMGMLVGSAAGVAAQDSSTNGIGQDYFTATTVEPADVVAPDETQTEMAASPTRGSSHSASASW